jgi:thiamine pyrophosphokinase
MNALVLTGGAWPEDARATELVKTASLIVCCDGAAKHARRLGIVPHVLIGDMDSIEEEDHAWMRAKGVHEVRLDRKKDETDTEAACHLAITRGAQRVALIGGLGGRTDHSLGNIQCLWMLHSEGVDARIESNGEMALIVSSSLDLGRFCNLTFSLIPLLSPATVFRMTGVRYPLTHALLPLGSTLGLSNVVESDSAQLTMQSGTALIIVNLKEGAI